VWPQCWDLQGPRGLEQRDLGDLKKGPNGGVSPTPQKKCSRDVQRGRLTDSLGSFGRLGELKGYSSHLTLRELGLVAYPTDKQNSPTSQQIPEVFPILTQAFPAPQCNLDIRAFNFLSGNRENLIFFSFYVGCVDG
jgi:hypothetical protein